MSLEELVARCKASVMLEVNEHRTSYQSVEQFLSEREAWDESLEIPADIRQRMVAEATIYYLHFYPDTPIGFYAVYGSTLDEVLRQAEECLK